MIGFRIADHVEHGTSSVFLWFFLESDLVAGLSLLVDGVIILTVCVRWVNLQDRTRVAQGG